jgi:hypothetical protein
VKSNEQKHLKPGGSGIIELCDCSYDFARHKRNPGALFRRAARWGIARILVVRRRLLQPERERQS